MSATDHLDGLCQALNDGRPLVLLLGQDAWKNGTTVDPVLKIAIERAYQHQPMSAEANFTQVLQAEALPGDYYEWLADTYFQQPTPTWIETIGRLPLNAVFTSSVDPSIARALTNNGRDVELILSNQDNPDTPRNRRNLHLTYLFGRAGECNPIEAPPRSKTELLQRTALHATPLISRLVDTTTSLGILLIDGLSCGRDWLSTETLAGVLSAFSPGQVYWFGWTNTGTNCSDLRDLEAPHGPIVFVKERLSAALRALELANKVDLSGFRQPASEGTVTIGDHILVIEPATRLKISTSAAIIEDSWLTQPQPLGLEAEYTEFRRFHGHVEDSHRLIDGMRRGFSIKRTFENKLRDRVLRALKNTGNKQDPILIHGQSGSGKSLALARLAYTIRKDNEYPVLLASRVTRMPAVEELDDFCLQAEEAGAEATLLICDANTTATRYGDLLRGFISRGRHVVVVGSAYRILDESDSNSTSSTSHLLEIPTELDETELSALSNLFAKWTGSPLRTTETRYLLPAIYRMLPDVRPRLAAGLAREARVTEDMLRTRGATKSHALPKGALGEALINAGIVNPQKILEEKIDAFLGTMTDAATKVIDLVMVPGKLDCPVPVNLLMRTVGASESLVDIAALFSGIDLFRWSSDDEDDVFVHPRLQIEAELITARRLGTSKAEAEVALRLLANSNPRPYGGCERRFVLDFVHRLGPDGPFGQRYASHYLDIARTLSEIRNKRGIKDPSLMLQEATLRRRIFRDAPDNADQDPAIVLEEARQIVDLAINEFCIAANSGARRACANLKVERAAIYGFRAVQQLKSGAGLDEVWQYYKAARDSARSAVFAAESYFAIDVSVWVPSDLLRQGRWETERHAELVADILDGLERVDTTQLDSDQQERYEERRIKVAKTLNDKRLEQEALAALESQGSRAGIFLQAREIGGALRGSGQATVDDMTNAGHVISFMRNYADQIRDDARCIRYFLRSLWIADTGYYLFGGERSPLPENDLQLNEILTFLDTLNDLEGALGDPRTQYLRAVVMWRLRREHGARDIWNSLSRETAFNDPRRVIRHHVWTESGGQPRLFHGRIISDDIHHGRARVQVDELRQDIELLQRDFPGQQLRRGITISGGFHIAFNFIGPIADPPKRQGAVR